MPSQGRNTSDCGVFMLGFISAYVNNIEMKFGVRDMPFLRSSFAKIIINGRPWHDCSNKFLIITILSILWMENLDTCIRR